MSFKDDLETNIRESYKLIGEYEEIIRLSSDPKEQARARRTIKEQWQLIKDHLTKYVPLCQRLNNSFPEDLVEIITNLSEDEISFSTSKLNAVPRFDSNTLNLNQIFHFQSPDQITATIQASLAKGRPQIFDNDGLCPGYSLTPSPDEYFVAHEVSPEKIADLRHALEQGLANTQLKPYTADQDIRPGHILCKIAAKIQTTAFCIFDLPEVPTRPGANNVYLELGIAIGLGRPFVLIKSGQAQPASLLEGLDTFGFGSYSRLRKEVSERVQIGQFSAILPQEDTPLTASYFLAEGEFEQENFREAIGNALQSYGLQPVYLAEGPVAAELILPQLILQIQTARFGIFRVDERASANTFLALGIAIGLNKPWLLVAREGAVIPQDVRGLSNFNFRSFMQLENEFADRCGEFLRRYAGEFQPALAQAVAKPRAESFTVPGREPDHQTAQPTKSSRRTPPMLKIPQTLMLPLQQALLACDEFYSPRQLFALFGVDELRPFQNGLPEADNVRGRVDVTIGYLIDKRRSSGENALILFLTVLGNRYDPADERHGRLLSLAEQLEWVNQRPVQPETTILEANKTAAQMIWIAETEKMLACARPVARVEVLRFRGGQESGRGTGTAWLVAPGLAVTCWHVIESLTALESTISSVDLKAQVDNTLLTFDYTVSGHGLQYRITTLEYPTAENHPLDYALLRLNDRGDAPLRDRGYLRLDLEAPLTMQTPLYIIQHPLGQPQQVAGDTFVKHLPGDERILYKTPTEPGTSGAPVFNRANWRVVALHNGENKGERLREGTLLKAILVDLKQYRPDLHQEIITAQSKKE